MTTSVLLLVLPIAASPPAPGPVGALPEGGPRLQVTLNDGWRYADGDIARAESVTHDDRGWRPVDLPHTWNIAEGIEETLEYRRGQGWYRRWLRLDPALRGRRLFLHFEGANQVADVYVNGRSAGRHVGGYTAFTFDITELVRFDGATLIAVRVDNGHDDDIPPLNADFTFYGGIYRDVWLVATAPVHVDMLDHGSAGIFVDTPEVSAELARVRVRGAIVNHTSTMREVAVVSRLLDPEGSEVARMHAPLRIAAGERAPFELSARVREPRLWSPESPAVYQVRTEISDTTLVDAVTVPLGFRWFAVDPQRGFSLNGEWRQLAGTNRHQDRMAVGNALTDEQHTADIALIRDDGFDFLRLAHYPQDRAVLAAADRLGLMVWEEIPIVNLITTSRTFAGHAERMLVEMIRQHYNHPSVVFWGYMNEVMLREPQPRPPDYWPAIVALARRLEARVEGEDPTRLTASAISFEEIDNGSGFQDVTDVLGLNLYFGWYYRDLASLGPWLDSLHARHPNRPVLVSEYGAGSDERVHTDNGQPFDFSSEYQRRFHEDSYPQLRERRWLVGTAVWNHFDFGSAHRQDTKPALNQKGLRFFDRSPKDVVFYYRSVLTDAPVVHIAATEFTRRAGSRTADAVQRITVYSNLDRLELLHDGRSLGMRQVSNARATWDVTLHDGPNRLAARGVAAGARFGHALTVEYVDRTGLFQEAASRADAPGRTQPAPLGGSRARSADAIAVNAGGHYQVVDDSGLVWEADRPYQPGGWGYVGGHAAGTHHRIAGTWLEPLYQVAREAMDAYRFDVNAGEYEVTLLFAEIRSNPDSPRAFDVEVNGLRLGERLHLNETPGPVSALRRTTRVRTHRDQAIEIRFLPQRGAAAIAGILIRRL